MPRLPRESRAAAARRGWETRRRGADTWDILEGNPRLLRLYRTAPTAEARRKLYTTIATAWAMPVSTPEQRDWRRVTLAIVVSCMEAFADAPAAGLALVRATAVAAVQQAAA